MELGKMIPAEEVDVGGQEQRLVGEEEISKQINDARDAGKTRAGYPREISGAGKAGKNIKGPRPHDKPGRKDPGRKETIRGRALVDK